MKIHAPALVLVGLIVLVALGQCTDLVQAVGIALLLVAGGLAAKELSHCYFHRSPKDQT